MARKRSKCRNKQGRMKKWNLKKQFNNLLDNNDRTGTSKHADKNNGNNKGNTAIYSHADYTALKKTVNQFCDWVKANEPTVKNLTDIKKEHYQKFLLDVSQGKKTATITTYLSRLEKLDRMADKDIGGYKRQTVGIIKPMASNPKTVARNKAMSEEDFNKIKELAYKPRRSENIQKALEIARRTGCRVSEIAKLQARDYNAQKGTLNIVDSKGGRSRTIKIKEADKPYFEGLKASCVSENERFVKIQHESINTGVRRLLKEAGLTEYIEQKTSIHAIRKLVAQELYDEQKALGKAGIEAFNPVSEYLGHGEGRYDLFNAYIKRP